ncbi:MAG TPA: ABC transporter substrate-binding protein [Methylomirabilota bacterium]|jgi:peptide/nickel transport system substrate-binding protein|nr:ABC transporter substrate-binding protein [Methylomirabilota bacterium]
MAPFRPVALLLAVLLVASLPTPGRTQPAAGSGLTVQLTAEPPGLDLTATPASATATVVFYNVQEALVKVDERGRLVPWLAERWYTADNLNYTFFLKRGVRFHNGRPFTAEDVKYVLDRARNPETRHPHVKHYEDITAIHVKDAHTVTISLRKPNAMFLYTLARQGSVMYPREAVEQLKSQPVGTGPFLLARWDRGDRIVLKRNPEYHVRGLPRLEQVTFRFIADQNAALAALQAGDVDVVAGVGLGPESVEVVRRAPNLQVIVGESTSDVILALNNSRKPYSDVRARRALTHAIDKEEVVKGAMFGLGRVLGTNIDALNPYFVDMSKAVPYNPEKAKQLLAEAGYPNGFDAVLKVPPQYPYTVRTGEVIVGQLARVGVRVRLEQIEWGQWLDRVYKQADYDMTIIGHAEAWDAGNYANPKYYFRYDSPRFQEIYEKSESTLDDGKRRALYHELQRIMVEEAPVVWLYAYPRIVAAKKGVQGIWKDLPTPSFDLSEVAWAK